MNNKMDEMDLMDEKNWPWIGCGKEFDDWFKKYYKSIFSDPESMKLIEECLKPLFYHIAASGWDAVYLTNNPALFLNTSDKSDKEVGIVATKKKMKQAKKKEGGKK